MEKITILLELTRRCNLLCKHCYNSSCIDSPLQLSLDEVKVLIKDIKQIESKYSIERIILTGGEFITMDNSKEIFQLFRDNFDCILRIETNGFLFYKNKEILEEYTADEFFLSVDKLHGTLKDDGSSDILDFFLKNTDKNIVARITIDKGMEDLRDAFIDKYHGNEKLTIEAKYISPSGRASENFKKFKGFKFNENPELFKCLAKNYIHFNVSRNWYCCYTACELSRFGKLGDKDLITKFESKYLSEKMCAIRDRGIIELLCSKCNNEEFYNKEFYYRCEPCLYLQNQSRPKIILVDLPCVDTTQDVYTKGFIFPTFTEKYLKKILEDNGIDVYYYNLNKVSLMKSINEINELKIPVYIHLVANKLYSFNLFKKLVKNEILVGGPLPKFESKKFSDVLVIKDELEEDGILKYFNIENKSIWENPVFCPNKIKNNFTNESVTNDFANIILLSRGCLYRCAFCIHACYHKKVHIRNLQSIALELNNYKNNTSIYIADASVGNLKLYGEILDLLAIYKNIKFSMNIRADQINQETIKKLLKINIDRLYIGVENPSDDKLKEYNKGEKSNDIINALQLLRNHNIEYHLSFIVSNDLLDTDIRKIDDIYKAKTYSFHYYIPYPGTLKYNGELEYFNDKNWPNKIYKNDINIFKLKKEISNYFNYPVNNYHTITPHDHTETFKIINKKLNELEKLVNESNKR